MLLLGRTPSEKARVRRGWRAGTIYEVDLVKAQETQSKKT